MSSEELPETDGCDECLSFERDTFDTPVFGPYYRSIVECWKTRRLEPSAITFVDAVCAGIASGSVSFCSQAEAGGWECECPDGSKTFSVPDCHNDTQEIRNQLTAEHCPRITCTPPPERPDVTCSALAGASNIGCTCEDGTTRFYLGSDCSTLTLSSIQSACPPL